MKILYAGPLDPGGTCYSRLVSMRRLHDEVTAFDHSELVRHIARVNPVSRELFYSRLCRNVNHELLEACRREQPDVLWLDKSEWISKKTVQDIKELGVFAVRHITDALYPKKSTYMLYQRRHLRQTMSEFDLVFTTNERDARSLATTLGGRVQLTDLGYDHRRFHVEPLPDELRKKWENEIVFVGHHEPRTESFVLAMIDAGLPVRVFGHTRWFRSKNISRLKPHLFPSLGDEDYELALKAAKIGFCCVSQWNYNETAARSFEIPGSGTFLLAIRTPHHSQCFREGVEAEFFETNEELVSKAKRYLQDDELRESVARKGYERCLESGYSWDAIMERDFAKLIQHYSQRTQTTIKA